MFERLPSTTRTILRAASGIAAAIVAGFATLVLGFLGAIEATGCFIECTETNPVEGGLLLAAAVVCAALTVTAVVWGAIGWNRRVLARVAGSAAALATLVVLAAVSIV